MSHLFFGGARRGHGYKCKAVTFDGSADYMRRGADLTGNADGKVGLISFWFKSGEDGPSDQFIIFNTTGYFTVKKAGADNKFYVYGYTSAGVEILQINSTAVLVADGWTHLMASWNLATPVTHLYINGVDAKTQTTAVDNTIDYTRADWSIGDNLAGAGLMNCDIAELYFALEFLDLSTAANRAKLYRGRPVDLEVDGSLPTGTSPIIYQSVRLGDAATVFATNKGSGGNFSITGALALASTSPSD